MDGNTNDAPAAFLKTYKSSNSRPLFFLTGALNILYAVLIKDFFKSTFKCGYKCAELEGACQWRVMHGSRTSVFNLCPVCISSSSLPQGPGLYINRY